jgi:amino acid transporter
MVFLGSLTVSELACRVSKHGALYAYLREGLGDWVGFVFAWGYMLLVAPSGTAFIALTFAQYLTSVIYKGECGTPPGQVKLIAVALIGLWDLNE